MGHGKNQLVMWIALAVAIAIPLYMWQRTRSVLRGFSDLIAAQRLVARPSSPVIAFASPNPPEGMHFAAAYDGALRPGTPMTLMQFRRTESVLVRGVPVQNATIYIGVYLPPQAKVDENWLATWQTKASGKQDHVVYAARPSEGGALIIWQGAPSQKNIEGWLAELRRTLPSN